MRTLSITMVVMLVFSTTVWAAGPVFAGNARTSGVVLTNSIQLPDGGTIHGGDSITTGKGLAVITSASHGRVEVRADSLARFTAGSVELERGVVASSRLTVETAGYTIVPQGTARNGEDAWFAVANRQGRLMVAAHRGTVLIAAAGAPPVVLPEGSYAEQDSTSAQQDAQPPAQAEEKDKGRKKKGAAAGAASGGWTIGSLSHAASVALVVGVGAGVAAASVGAAVALSDEGPSPK